MIMLMAFAMLVGDGPFDLTGLHALQDALSVMPPQSTTRADLLARFQVGQASTFPLIEETPVTGRVHAAPIFPFLVQCGFDLSYRCPNLLKLVGWRGGSG